jgi:catechol 2,3-dioxygenase-like lactoylglutathione lyase family enzyme
MTYQPFFHVGILVKDIEEAAVDFNRLLGLEFEPVRSAPIATGQLMTFQYSLQGPPFLELVQMTENETIWGPNVGEGLHHIAFGVDDVPGQCLIFNNQTDTVVAGGEDDAPRVIFTHPETLHGLRIEYLQTAMVAATFERLRT